MCSTIRGAGLSNHPSVVLALLSLSIDFPLRGSLPNILICPTEVPQRGQFSCLPRLTQGSQPQFNLVAPRPDNSAPGRGIWVCYRGKFRLTETGRDLNVMTDTVAYYQAPPPEFWHLSIPSISGCMVITRLLPDIKAQDYTSPVVSHIDCDLWLTSTLILGTTCQVRTIMLHLSDFTCALQDNRLRVGVMVWLQGVLFQMDKDAVHLRVCHS